MQKLVCFGEVLWDILPTGPLPGGAPMNVAFHLKKLGLDPAVISKTGADEYGMNLKSILEKNGVTTNYIDTDNRYPTGLVYANTNDQNEVVYDIVQPSAWDFIQWTQQQADLVQEANYFIYGSLACRNHTSRDTLNRLLRIAKTKVLDINLRPPHFDRTQVEKLLQNCDMLKMNNHELDLITGWFGNFESSFEAIQFLQDRFDIDTIIVTRGAEGAMVNNGGKLYQHEGYKVKVADTIGSGDAFLAGFLAEQVQGASIEKSLDFAAAIGAFIATKPGACPTYDTSEILKMMSARVMKNLHT